jgi:predicted AlkP superfamily pyrophosphatase or phosphodiesterase
VDERDAAVVTASKAGVKTAESHWPNADVNVGGVDFIYHNTLPWSATPDADTATVLSWFDKPAAERPGLALVHYSTVDQMGHVFGPDAPQVNAAIGGVDAAIAKLVDGLKTRGLYDTANIVIVSDHGMTFLGATPPGYILDTMLDLNNNVSVSVEGADAGFWPKPDMRRKWRRC